MSTTLKDPLRPRESRDSLTLRSVDLRAAQPPRGARPVTYAGRQALVIDEREAAAQVAGWLARTGWQVKVSAGRDLKGPELLQLIHTRRPQLVLFDPRALSFDWKRWLPLDWEEPAAIVVSGPARPRDRAAGLRAGVRYWLNKPIDPDELLAVVDAALRDRGRASTPPVPAAPKVLRTGELELDLSAWCCRVSGRSLALTAREFALLSAFAAAPDQVLSRAELYRQAWGGKLARGDRAVDVFVRKLRVKLGMISPDWCYIHTHEGRGYRFAAERRASAAAA